jgi:hypothetical protein
VKTAGKEPGAPAEETTRKLQDLESRVSQLLLAMDEQRNALHRFLLFAGLVFCVGILGVAGYTIYLQMKARIEPPRNIGFAQIPVKVGDHTAMLGVAVVSWELPPEMNAVVQQAAEQLKRELEAQIAKELGTNVSAATNALRPSK